MPRVPKDNKKYDIYVETMPDKFAPQKKVSHTFRADDYVKSIKLVLNRTDTGLKQSRSVSSLVYLLPIVIGAILAYGLWDQMPQFVKNMAEFASNTSQSSRRSSDDASNNFPTIADVSSTPSAGKRRNKKR